MLYKILNTKPNILALAALAAVATLLLSAPAQASGLKITPLKYEEVLEIGESKTGYVDVANPGDRHITVQTGVEGFRQINSQGDLEFYEDEQLSVGIQIDVDEFELGPREAARIQFDIDSNNLPEGGVYAALFFETDTQETVDDLSGIGTLARVGTLLILQNGEGEKTGAVDELSIPFWQFGSGISGSLSFHNDDTEVSVGFTPELTMQVTPWGETEAQDSGLVLPGVSREFPIERPGSYIGILPVSVADEVTGAEGSAWVFAVTGIWRILLPFFLIAVLVSLVLQRYFQKR